MAKAERPGKVFVDWSQNDRHKTTVCAYSLRIARPADGLDAADVGRGARPRSTPATGDALAFEAPAVLERVAERRRPLRRLAHRAPGAARALASPPWISTGKVAIVTGASRGRRRRHRACCSPSAGCKVVCAARATDAAPLPIPGTIDDTVRRITDAGGDAIAVPTNLAKDAEVERMVATTVEHFGPVDVLVNNAAITFPGDLDLEMKRFDLVMQVDLRAPLHRDPRGDARR